MLNGPFLNLINMYAYSKFDQNLSNCSQDIEWKQNFNIKKINGSILSLPMYI